MKRKQIMHLYDQCPASVLSFHLRLKSLQFLYASTNLWDGVKKPQSIIIMTGFLENWAPGTYLPRTHATIITMVLQNRDISIS